MRCRWKKPPASRESFTCTRMPSKGILAVRHVCNSALGLLTETFDFLPRRVCRRRLLQRWYLDCSVAVTVEACKGAGFRVGPGRPEGATSTRVDTHVDTGSAPSPRPAPGNHQLRVGSAFQPSCSHLDLKQALLLTATRPPHAVPCRGMARRAAGHPAGGIRLLAATRPYQLRCLQGPRGRACAR